jgi:hypothetical protein
MQALAASCEELRARTGKPPLQIYIELMRVGSHANCMRGIFEALDELIK